MADVGELVDLLDLAVAAAGGVSTPADRQAAATIAAAQRRRRDYLGAAIVVLAVPDRLTMVMQDNDTVT